MNHRRACCNLSLVVCCIVAPAAFATSPRVDSLIPAGGQRGTELEATFAGERLQDAQEIFCYEPGIQVLKLLLITNKTVTAQLKISPDCALGEHHLRVRTATGLSELMTFFVGSLPENNEKEPNNDSAHAQKIDFNSTINGVVNNEDVDCFLVDVKKAQRFSVEVEGMRLGRGPLDARLTVLKPDGSILADSDDTWLGVQDPFISLLAPVDGQYTIQLREVTYGGSDKCHYRLHVGSFPRPTSVFPLGGKVGETVAFAFFSEATGEFTQKIKLPDKPDEKFGVFAASDKLTAPTPNWIRVSDFPNVIANADNRDREHATATDLQPPLALNGIIAKKDQESWFRFNAVKGTALEVNAYARRLRSPMDPVIEICDAVGKNLASNDDSVGADSSLKFTPNETTNYFVRVRDTLHEGGRDFTFRIEVTPTEPSLAIKIPEVSRNDTQSRQYIAVPRGNRFATLISAKRANFGGELNFEIGRLPDGVKMVADHMSPNTDSMPLVFKAGSDAPIAGKLLDLTAIGTNNNKAVFGYFRQDVELVQGAPNNANYCNTSVENFCVAVTKESPFRLRIVEPKVPVVQAGTMRLEVIAERATNFDEPIELNMVWNPPGMSSQSEATIPKGATNIFYQLNAGGGAETRTWKIAILGHAKVDGGELYVSTQLAPIEVAPPFLSGKIETTWLNPGKSAELTVNLKQLKPFEGKATIRLLGLPENVSVSDRDITCADQEVVFKIQANEKCATGSHKNLFCAVDVQQNGQVIPHTIAQGGILRIVPPKKEKEAQKVASAEKNK
jgi:hypothetical protein